MRARDIGLGFLLAGLVFGLTAYVRSGSGDADTPVDPDSESAEACASTPATAGDKRALPSREQVRLALGALAAGGRVDAGPSVAIPPLDAFSILLAQQGGGAEAVRTTLRSQALAAGRDCSAQHTLPARSVLRVRWQVDVRGEQVQVWDVAFVPTEAEPDLRPEARSCLLAALSRRRVLTIKKGADSAFQYQGPIELPVLVRGDRG